MWESATLGMSECNAWILRVCLGAMAHATEKALHSYHKNGKKTHQSMGQPSFARPIILRNTGFQHFWFCFQSKPIR